jgi:hypothetical protein
MSTLEILNTFPQSCTTLPKFFNALETHGSYYNAYLRVKKELIDAHLVGFKLNEAYEKEIFLTADGILVLDHLKVIEQILEKNLQAIPLPCPAPAPQTSTIPE